MTNENDEKLILPPETTLSSYERVLEWNTEEEREEVHPIGFIRRPMSVPSDEHHPQGMGSLRDDMALPLKAESTDPFDVIGYEQWGGNETREMDQGKVEFVNVDEVSLVITWCWATPLKRQLLRIHLQWHAYGCEISIKKFVQWQD